jgi:hypothetical protein
MFCFISKNFCSKNVIILFFLLISVNLFIYFNFWKNLKIIHRKNYPLFTLIKNISLLLCYFLYKFEKTNITKFYFEEKKGKYKLKSKELKLFNILEIENLFLLLIISLVDVLYGNYFLYINRLSGELSEIISFFLYLKLFNYNLYKHHLIGIILSSISFILLLINLLFIEKINILVYFDSVLIFILTGISYIFQKYMIDIKYADRFIILFYKGLFSLIIIFISQIFYYIFDKNMLINFNKLFNNILCLGIYFILILIYEIISIMLIKEAKNITFFLLIIFSNFISVQIFPIKNKYLIKSNNNYYFFIFIHSINIVGSLIFMEIITLNFCNLNKNIEEEIIRRSIIEKKEVENFILYKPL